jgi:dsRNA-specific ribonuclease
MNITSPTSVQDLINRLQAIAKKNKDEFKYSIDLLPKGKEITYSFKAEETADGHCFTSGYGATIDEAVAAAAEYIERALEQWGYKDAK